jgi:hypothetical protein
MYTINGQTRGFEALPGKEGVNHNYIAHSYSLPCGDVYVVTAAGDIVFVDRDSESKICVWNSFENGLWPCYYKPVTGHVGTQEIETGGSTTFVPIYCVESHKRSHPTWCPSAISEDCICIMLNTYNRVTEGSNHCVVFRRGIVIYKGCCDFRGVPYISTRGNSKMGNYYQSVGEQQYQWAKDKNGKYLGEGLDKSKTWEWVNVFSTNINANIWQDEACAEYAVSDLKQEGGFIRAQWHDGCERCIGNDNSCPNTQVLDLDKGEFSKHTINDVWFGKCDPIDGCYCVTSRYEGIEIIDNSMIYGAQICDLGGGFAIIPIQNSISRTKEYTWIDTINDVSQLPGYSGNLNVLDQNELDSYQIILSDNQAPAHNGLNPVLRTGIQYNDCFIIGNDFYRFEYNGWKFYEDYKKYRNRINKWALITPQMTDENSAMDGCNPAKIITGADVTRCGRQWILATYTDLDGEFHYCVINTDSSAFLEGIGQVQIACAGCFLLIYSNEGDIWSYSLYNAGLSLIYGWTSENQSDIRNFSTGDRPDLEENETNHFYATVTDGRTGASVRTVICCDSVIGTWQISNTNLLGRGISLELHYQQFYGTYDATTKEAIVIERCDIVFKGCGTITNVWGISNSAVKTCKCIEAQERWTYNPGYNSATLYSCDPPVERLHRGYSWFVDRYYLWIDLVTGETGEYLGTDNTNPSMVNVYDGTSTGIYTTDQINQMLAETRLNAIVDSPSPPVSNQQLQIYTTVQIDPDESGNAQEMLIGINWKRKAMCGLEVASNGTQCTCLIRNKITGVIKKHSQFDVPDGAKSIVYDIAGSQGYSANGVLVIGSAGRPAYSTMDNTIWGDEMDYGCHSTQRQMSPSNYGSTMYWRVCTDYATQQDFSVAAVIAFNVNPDEGSILTGGGNEWVTAPSQPCRTELLGELPYQGIFIDGNGYSSSVIHGCAACAGKVIVDLSVGNTADPNCKNVPYTNDSARYLYSALQKKVTVPMYPRFVTFKKDGTIILDSDNGLGNEVLPYPLFASVTDETSNTVCDVHSKQTIATIDKTNRCGTVTCCQKYCLSSGFGGKNVSYGTNTAVLPYLPSSSAGYSIPACCTTREQTYEGRNVVSETDGHDVAIISGGGIVYFVTDGSIVWSSSFTGNLIARLQCRCGFVSVRISDSTGDLIRPGLYNIFLSWAPDALGMDCDTIDLQCCNGYGIARCGQIPYPDIAAGTDVAYTPTVTAENYKDLLNDPRCTIATLDDGTKCVGKYGYYDTYDCDGGNRQRWYFIQEWSFVGSDGKVRTVNNTYGGNPGSLVSGAINWVPFKYVNPTRATVIYKLKNNSFDGVVVADKDITRMRCNFYDTQSKLYLGADISVENGNLEAGFEQEYKWPPDAVAFCNIGTVQNSCRIVKSMNNYRLIDAGAVDGIDAFMRYGINQRFDPSTKNAQKGILTNAKYQGKYELLRGSNTTGVYSDFDDLEQETRKDTKFGGEGNYPLIVNDREAMAKFDRIRGFSQNYYSTFDVVIDLKLPTKDQTRSVFTQNGTCMILDKDLGLITVDCWGNDQS